MWAARCTPRVRGASEAPTGADARHWSAVDLAAPQEESGTCLVDVALLVRFRALARVVAAVVRKELGLLAAYRGAARGKQGGTLEHGLDPRHGRLGGAALAVLQLAKMPRPHLSSISPNPEPSWHTNTTVGGLAFPARPAAHLFAGRQDLGVVFQVMEQAGGRTLLPAHDEKVGEAELRRVALQGRRRRQAAQVGAVFERELVGRGRRSAAALFRSRRVLAQLLLLWQGRLLRPLVCRCLLAIAALAGAVIGSRRWLLRDVWQFPAPSFLLLLLFRLLLLAAAISGRLASGVTISTQLPQQLLRPSGEPPPRSLLQQLL